MVFLFASCGPSSFFVFWLFCFEFCLFFVFSFLSKKRPPKKPDTAKTQKSKNAEKKDSEKKKNSAIVFTNSVLQFFGVGLKFSFFPENTIKIVVLVHFKIWKKPKNYKNCWVKTWSKGWVKTWSKYVAQHNWTRFWLKKWCFFLSFFLLVFL